jgi:hypothetical protein
VSTQKEVTVRFTETFLCNSERVLQEGELRLIAMALAENPKCGFPSKEVQNLFCMSWPRSEEEEASCNIWYLTYPGVPHIEVVALTQPSDNQGDDAKIPGTAWKVMRIGLLLRSLYKLYKVVHNHIDDFPDLTSFGG